MSTILKALRRLEREKSARSDRSLGEEVANASPPAPSRRPARWLVAGGVLAGALVIAAVVFLVLPSRDEAEGGDPVEIAATPQNPSPARPTAKLRRRTARTPAASAWGRELPARGTGAEARIVPHAQPAAPPELSPSALSSEVEVVKRIRPANPSSEPSAAEAAPAEAPSRSQRATEQPARPSGSAENPAARPKPRSRRPAAPEAEKSVQLASAAPAAKPPPTPRAEPPPGPAPPAAESEPILRSPVPTVYVERTIWHPMAERRVAVVALEGNDETLELHEGDAVGPLVVGKIEPSGVFFVHDGVELRRRVGAR
jgi:hypothetical protein